MFRLHEASPDKPCDARSPGGAPTSKVAVPTKSGRLGGVGTRRPTSGLDIELKSYDLTAMKIVELNHVALIVSDLEASSRFYHDILGLPPLQRPAFSFPGAWFRIGAAQELHLIAGRTAALENEGSRAGHFAMRVPDIQAAASHFKEKRLKFRGPLDRPDGAQQIFIEDPDGHTIEICRTD